MTYEEALRYANTTEFCKLCCGANEMDCNICKPMEFSTIAAGLLRKQIPEKPVHVRDNGTGTRCPACHCTVLKNWKPNYCMVCGQAIDWSEYGQE